MPEGRRRHTDAMLLEVGADVDWTDAPVGAAAAARMPAGSGRLRDAVEWLAAARAGAELRRPRCIVIGQPATSVVELGAQLEVGVRAAPPPDDAADGLAAGVAIADAEVDSGADLIVAAGSDPSPAAALAVAVLTGTEPVALLPRGAQATDSAAWVERAAALRDARRRAIAVRSRPDELLAMLGSPTLAVLTGLTLQAAARRTPVLLDGAAAVAAALLGRDVQARAVRWWRVADTADDPVHIRAVEQLADRPLLDLGTTLDDGTAGLLAFAVLRAAALTLGAAGE